MDDLKDNRFKPWMKITALFTAFFFCATNLVSADIVQTINSSNHPAPALDLAKISLPESIGEVRKIFNGKNDSFVVHIQDAHASDETQLNISEILNYFYKRFGLRVIGVEGASQELRTDAYSFFPFKDAREAASKYFLKEGRLSGPEYFGVVEQPQAILVGVEDQKLYEENREAYLAALKTKQGDEELIRGILKQLNALARFALSPELRELLEKSYRFDVEPDQFMDYVSYLLAAAKSNQIDQAQYARVAELERISVMGKKIQSESAIRQLDRLLKELPMILSNQESRDFEDRVSGFQRRLISKKEFYGFVIASIKNVTDAKFQTKYADVLSYLEYLIAADGIDLKVMDEINRLEELLKEKLFQGQTDRLVAELFARAEILSNLFDFSLTKEDAQKYFANRNTYSVSEFRQAICPEIKKHRGECSIDARFDLLDEHRKSIDTFYQAAIQRDSVLIEKSIQTMKKRKVGIAALVTGGFHTAGIEKRLEELGYSYVTIVPAIRKKMDLVKGEKLYQESLREDPLRIEKIIRDEKRISTRELSDPRFQLSARKMVPVNLRFLSQPSDGYLAYAYFISMLAAGLMLTGDIEKVRSEIRGARLHPDIRSALSAILNGSQMTPSSISIPIIGTEKSLRLNRPRAEARSGENDWNAEVARVLSENAVDHLFGRLGMTAAKGSDAEVAARIRQLEQAVLQAQAAVTSANQRALGAEANVAALSAENSKLANALQQLTNERDRFSGQLAAQVFSAAENDRTLRGQISQLQQTIQGLHAENRTQRQRLEGQLQNLLNQAQTAIQNLQNQITQLTEQNKKELAERESLISALRIDIDTLKTQLAQAAQNERQNLEAQIEKLKEEHLQAVSRQAEEFMEARQQFVDAEIILKDQISALQEEKEGWLNERTAAAESSQASLAQIQDLENQIRLLREMQLKLQAERNELEAKIQQFEAQLVNKDQDHAKEIAALKSEVDDLKSKLGKLPQQIAEASEVQLTEINGIKEQYQAVNEQLSQQMAELKRLHIEQIQIKDERIAVLEGQLAGRLANLDQIGQDQEALRSQIARLEEDKGVLQNEKVELERRLIELRQGGVAAQAQQVATPDDLAKLLAHLGGPRNEARSLEVIKVAITSLRTNQLKLLQTALIQLVQQVLNNPDLDPKKSLDEVKTQFGGLVPTIENLLKEHNIPAGEIDLSPIKSAIDDALDNVDVKVNVAIDYEAWRKEFNAKIEAVRAGLNDLFDEAILAERKNALNTFSDELAAKTTAVAGDLSDYVEQDFFSQTAESAIAEINNIQLLIDQNILIAQYQAMLAELQKDFAERLEKISFQNLDADFLSDLKLREQDLLEQREAMLQLGIPEDYVRHIQDEEAQQFSALRAQFDRKIKAHQSSDTVDALVKDLDVINRAEVDLPALHKAVTLIDEFLQSQPPENRLSVLEAVRPSFQNIASKYVKHYSSNLNSAFSNIQTAIENAQLSDTETLLIDAPKDEFAQEVTDLNPQQYSLPEVIHWVNQVQGNLNRHLSHKVVVANWERLRKILRDRHAAISNSAASQITQLGLVNNPKAQELIQIQSQVGKKLSDFSDKIQLTVDTFRISSEPILLINPKKRPFYSLGMTMFLLTHGLVGVLVVSGGFASVGLSYLVGIGIAMVLIAIGYFIKEGGLSISSLLKNISDKYPALYRGRLMLNGLNAPVVQELMNDFEKYGRLLEMDEVKDGVSQKDYQGFKKDYGVLLSQVNHLLKLRKSLIEHNQKYSWISTLIADLIGYVWNIRLEDEGHEDHGTSLSKRRLGLAFAMAGITAIIFYLPVLFRREGEGKASTSAKTPKVSREQSSPEEFGPPHPELPNLPAADPPYIPSDSDPKDSVVARPRDGEAPEKDTIKKDEKPTFSAPILAGSDADLRRSLEVKLDSKTRLIRHVENTSMPAEELEIVREFTRKLGFNLPDRGWYEAWKARPEHLKVLAGLTPEERLIVTGKLFTLEDWAEMWIVPMMKNDLQILDLNQSDYAPIVIPAGLTSADVDENSRLRIEIKKYRQELANLLKRTAEIDHHLLDLRERLNQLRLMGAAANVIRQAEQEIANQQTLREREDVKITRLNGQHKISSDLLRQYDAQVSERERRKKARLNFLRQLSIKLDSVKSHFVNKYSTGIYLDGFEKLHQSLRFDSDDIATLHKSWQEELKRQHGDFLLIELLGLVVSETVSEAVNSAEQKQQQLTEQKLAALIQQNPEQVFMMNMQLYSGYMGTAEKSVSYYDNLRQTLGQWRLMYSNQPFPTALENAIDWQAFMNAYKVRTQRVTDRRFDLLFKWALEQVTRAGLLASRSRYQDPHLDLQWRETLLGNYTVEEQRNLAGKGTEQVALPATAVSRDNEYRMKLIMQNRFPFNEAAHGSFRNLNFLSYFAQDDPTKVAEEDAAKYFVQAYELLNQMLKGEDPAQGTQSFVAWLNAYSGTGGVRGDSFSLEAANSLWKFAEELNSSRDKRAVYDSQVKKFADAVKDEIQVQRQLGRKYSLTYSPDVLKSMGETAYDFSRNHQIAAVGGEALLIQEMAKLLDDQTFENFARINQPEFGYFFEQKQEFNSQSFMEMVLQGNEVMVFGIDPNEKDNLRMSVENNRRGLQVAQQMADDLKKWKNLQRIPVKYQETFAVMLRLIDEVENPGEWGQYQVKVRNLLAKLKTQSVTLEIPHPAQLALELEKQESTQDARRGIVYAYLIRTARSMMLDAFKNDRNARLKEGYDEILRQSQDELEARGYQWIYFPELKRNAWSLSRGADRDAVKSEVLKDILGLKQENGGLVRKAFSKIDLKYAMLAEARPLFEKLLGRELNLSDPFYQDQALFAKLINDAIDRNISISELTDILKRAVELRDHAEYTDIMDKYIRVVDKPHQFFFDPAYDPVDFKWNFERLSVAQILEEWGYKRLGKIRNGKNVMVWYQSRAGQWHEITLGAAKIKDLESRAKTVSARRAKQAEILLGSILADAEASLRLGGVLRLTDKKKSQVRHLHWHPELLEQYLAATRGYYNMKNGLRGQNPISAADDSVLGREKERSLGGLLDAISKVKGEDPRVTDAEIVKEAKIELAKMDMMSLILLDYRKPKDEQLFVFENLVNPVTGEKTQMHAFDYVRQFAGKFYSSVYDPASSPIQSNVQVSTYDYSQKPLLEGLVNSLIYFGLDPQNLPAKPAAAAADAERLAYLEKVRDLVGVSLDAVTKIAEMAADPNYKKSTLVVDGTESREVIEHHKEIFLRAAFEDMYFLEKPWQQDPARFSGVPRPIQSSDIEIFKDQSSGEWHYRYKDREVEALYQTTFKSFLPYYGTAKGKYFSLWRNAFYEQLKALRERSLPSGDEIKARPIPPATKPGDWLSALMMGQFIEGVASNAIVDRRVWLARTVLAAVGGASARSEARSIFEDKIPRRFFLGGLLTALSGFFAGKAKAADPDKTTAVGVAVPADRLILPNILEEAEKLSKEGFVLAPVQPLGLKTTEYFSALAKPTEKKNRTKIWADGKSVELIPSGRVGERFGFEVYLKEGADPARRGSVKNVFTGREDNLQGVRLSIPASDKIRTATSILIENDRVVVQMTPDDVQGVSFELGHLLSKDGKVKSRPTIKKVVITTDPTDKRKIQAHILFVSESLSGAAFIDFTPLIENPDAEKSGKNLAVAMKLFARNDLSGDAEGRVMPVSMNTLFIRPYDPAINSPNAIALHDTVVVNQRNVKGEITQTNYSLTNPEPSLPVIKDLRVQDHAIDAISVQRTDRDGSHAITAMPRAADYRLDILSEAATWQTMLINQHSRTPTDLRPSALRELPSNVKLGIVHDVAALKAGESFEFQFVIREYQQGPALQLQKAPQVEAAIEKHEKDIIDAELLDFETHRRRIRLYIDQHYEESLQAAQKFYEALYGAAVFAGANPKLQRFVDLAGKPTFKQEEIPGDVLGLLEGFLYGAAREPIVDPELAFQKWLKVSAQMAIWLKEKDNKDVLLKNLAVFYDGDFKALIADRNASKRDVGRILSWARFFSEKNPDGSMAKWPGTMKQFFEFAQLIKNEKIAYKGKNVGLIDFLTKFGRDSFNLNDPYHVGIITSWANVMHKTSADELKNALEILAASAAEWRLLDEGEVIFFVKYLPEVKALYASYGLDYSHREVFRSIKVAEEAQKKAADNLLKKADALDWSWLNSPGEKASVMQNIKILRNEGISKEKAVYLATRHMPTQGYSAADMVAQVEQDIFHQAVFMLYHKDDAGASKRLSEGELGELIRRARREGFSSADIGRLIRYRALYIVFQAQARKTLAEGGTITIGGLKVTIEALGENAYAHFPMTSPGEIEGTIIDFYKRGWGQDLEWWKQTFEDITWMQYVVYTAKHQNKPNSEAEKKFVDWSLVWPTLYKVRGEDYDFINVHEADREKLRAASVNLEQMFFINLGDQEVYAFLINKWRTITSEVLASRNTSARTQRYEEALRTIYKELRKKGYQPGDIRAKQAYFLEKLASVRAGYSAQLAKYIYENGGNAHASQQIADKLETLEKVITPGLIDTVVSGDSRVELAQYITQLYNIPQEVILTTPDASATTLDAKVRNVRTKRAAELDKKLDAKNPSSFEEYKILFESLRLKAAARRQELIRAKLYRERADAVDESVDLIGFLISKMRTEGLTEDEVVERYVGLQLRAEQLYRTQFLANPDALLDSNQKGDAGSFAFPIGDRVNFDSSEEYTQEIENALRARWLSVLRQMQSRYQAGEKTNPLAKGWSKRIGEEITKAENMTLADWRELEFKRVQDVLSMARFIQNKFNAEVGMRFSNEEAQIMAYNAFMGAIETKNIGDWVKAIQQKIIIWADIVKTMKSAMPKNMPVEEMVYYADQWLELHLAQPIREVGSAEAEIRLKVKEILSGLRINLSEDVTEKIVAAMKHRRIHISALTTLVEKVKVLKKQIGEERTHYERADRFSDRDIAPRGLYDILGQVSDTGFLAFLDNVNTHPDTHIGFQKIFGLSQEYMDKHVERPINAMYKNIVEKRLKEDIDPAIWTKHFIDFEKFRLSFKDPRVFDTITPDEKPRYEALRNLGIKSNITLAILSALISFGVYLLTTAARFKINDMDKKHGYIEENEQDKIWRERYEKVEKWIVWSRYLPFMAVSFGITAFLVALNVLTLNLGISFAPAVIFVALVATYLLGIIVEGYLNGFLIHVVTVFAKSYYPELFKNRMLPPIDPADITDDKSFMSLNPLRPTDDDQLRNVIRKEVKNLLAINSKNYFSVLILQAVGNSAETYKRYEEILRKEVFDRTDLPQDVKDRFYVFQMGGIGKPHNMYKVFRWLNRLKENDDPVTGDFIFGVNTEENMPTAFNDTNFRYENGLVYYGGKDKYKGKDGQGAKGGILATQAGIENLRRIRNEANVGDGLSILANFKVLDADNYTDAVTDLRMINSMNDEFMVWQPWITFYNANQSTAAYTTNFMNRNLGHIFQHSGSIVRGGVRTFGKSFGRAKMYVREELTAKSDMQQKPDFAFLWKVSMYALIFFFHALVFGIPIGGLLYVLPLPFIGTFVLNYLVPNERIKALNNRFQNLFPLNRTFLQSEDAYHGKFGRATYIMDQDVTIFEATPASYLTTVLREVKKWGLLFDARDIVVWDTPVVTVLKHIDTSYYVSLATSVALALGLTAAFFAGWSFFPLAVLSVISILSVIKTYFIWAIKSVATVETIQKLRETRTPPHSVRGEYSDALVRRGTFSEGVWASDLGVKFYAMGHPGILETAYPFLGEYLFLGTMIMLIHAKFTGPLLTKIYNFINPEYRVTVINDGIDPVTKKPRRHIEIRQISRWRAAFELFIVWPLHDVPVAFYEFMKTSSMFLLRLPSKWMDTIWYMYATYLSLRALTSGKSVPGTWPSFREDSVTLPFQSPLIKFRAAKVIAIATLMLTVPFFKPLMAIPIIATIFSPTGLIMIGVFYGVILGVLPFLSTLGNRQWNGALKKYEYVWNVTLEGDLAFPALQQRVHLISSLVIAGVLISLGFYAPFLGGLIQADLVIRASTILIASFFFGSSWVWFDGINWGTPDNSTSPPSMKGMAFMSPLLAVAFGWIGIFTALYMASQGTDPFTLIGLGVGGQIATGDGIAATPIATSLSFNEMLRMSTPYTFFFTSILYAGAFFQGGLAYILGFLSWVWNIVSFEAINRLDDWYEERGLGEASEADVDAFVTDLIDSYMLLPWWGQIWAWDAAKEIKKDIAQKKNQHGSRFAYVKELDEWYEAQTKLGAVTAEMIDDQVEALAQKHHFLPFSFRHYNRLNRIADAIKEDALSDHPKGSRRAESRSSGTQETESISRFSKYVQPDWIESAHGDGKSSSKEAIKHWDDIKSGVIALHDSVREDELQELKTKFNDNNATMSDVLEAMEGFFNRLGYPQDKVYIYGAAWKVGDGYASFKDHRRAILGGVKEIDSGDFASMLDGFREKTDEAHILRQLETIRIHNLQAISERERKVFAIAVAVHDIGRYVTTGPLHPKVGAEVVRSLLDKMDFLTIPERNLIVELTRRELEFGSLHFGETIPEKVLKGLDKLSVDQELFLKMMAVLYIVDARSIPRYGSLETMGLLTTNNIDNAVFLSSPHHIRSLQDVWGQIRWDGMMTYDSAVINFAKYPAILGDPLDSIRILVDSHPNFASQTTLQKMVMALRNAYRANSPSFFLFLQLLATLAENHNISFIGLSNDVWEDNKGIKKIFDHLSEITADPDHSILQYRFFLDESEKKVKLLGPRGVVLADLEYRLTENREIQLQADTWTKRSESRRISNAVKRSELKVRALSVDGFEYAEGARFKRLVSEITGLDQADREIFDSRLSKFATSRNAGKKFGFNPASVASAYKGLIAIQMDARHDVQFIDDALRKYPSAKVLLGVKSANDRALLKAKFASELVDGRVTISSLALLDELKTKAGNLAIYHVTGGQYADDADSRLLVRSAELSAAQLSQQSVVVLGVYDQKIANSKVISVSDILQGVLNTILAAQKIAQSA